MEIKKLLSAFDRVDKGSTELLLVSGYSGVGKSSLIGEIRKTVALEGGFFIQGKFEQFGRNSAYLAITKAIAELVRQVLAGEDTHLTSIREQLIEAMGLNGSVLSVGTTSYPLIGGALATFAWNYPFLLALAAVPVGFLVLRFLHNPEPHSKASLRVTGVSFG